MAVILCGGCIAALFALMRSAPDSRAERIAGNTAYALGIIYAAALAAGL